MAIETTPLGFQKPDGLDPVRNGDNLIAANGAKAEELHQDARGRLTVIEAKNATQDAAIAAARTNATADANTYTDAQVATDRGRLGAIEAKNVTQDADIAEVESKLPTTVDHPGFLSITTDEGGSIAEGIKDTGARYTAQAEIDRAVVKTLEADSFTQAGQTLAAVTGAEYSQITTDSEGRIAEDALDAGGRVPAWILDAWVSRMAPTLRATMGVTPELKLASWGDSMTFGLNGAGTTFPATAAADLGWSHYNGGVSSQTSTEIALRQGGLDVLVTVAGNTIPASGAVTVTVTPTSSWRAGLAWTFPGTLSGITGTLAKSATEVWTFTRTIAGTATTSLPGAKFMSTPATPHNNWVTTIWAGRNNATQSIIERDVAAMVKSLVPAKPRYLVFAVCNTSTESSGTGGYNSIVAINNALAATYAGNFFDVRRWLVDNGLTAAGITPTAADTTAIAEDRIPPSLMSDSIHLTAAGYAAVGHRVAAIITEKRWNQ